MSPYSTPYSAMRGPHHMPMRSPLNTTSLSLPFEPTSVRLELRVAEDGALTAQLEAVPDVFLFRGAMGGAGVAPVAPPAITEEACEQAPGMLERTARVTDDTNAHDGDDTTATATTTLALRPPKGGPPAKSVSSVTSSSSFDLPKDQQSSGKKKAIESLKDWVQGLKVLKGASSKDAAKDGQLAADILALASSQTIAVGVILDRSHAPPALLLPQHASFVSSSAAAAPSDDASTDPYDDDNSLGAALQMQADAGADLPPMVRFPA